MSNPRRRASQGLYLTLFIALVCLIYRPLFLGEAILDRDILRWLLPARWVLREALEHHRLPLWNPYQGIGFPLLSDPLYGPFYPPTVLSLRGPPVGSAMFFLLSHSLSGGVASFFLARRLKSSLPAALLAALSWTLSGYISSEWCTGIRLLSSSYFPWSALAWLSLSRCLRERPENQYFHSSLAALPAALVFLSGEVFLALIVSAFGLMVSLSDLDLKDPINRSRYLRAALLALGLTALSASVTVIPAAYLVASTERASALVPSIANGFSLLPSRIIELFAPGCLGFAFMYARDHALAYTGDDLLNYSVYLGATPLSLGLCAPFKQRIPRVLGLLALLFVLLSLGPATPLLPLLRLVIRPLAYMRSPEKFLAGVVPLVSALCALGTTRLLSSQPLPFRRLLAFASLLGAYAALSPWMYSKPIAPFIYANCLRSLALVLCVLAIARFTRARPALMATLLTLTLFLDLGQHASILPNYSLATAASRPPVSLRSTHPQSAARAPAPLRIYRSESIPRASALYPLSPARSFMVDALLDNTSVLFGVAILPGYDAAMPTALTALLATRRRDALRLLSVDYALLSAPSPDPDARRPGFETISSPLPGVRLYRVEDSLPRVFVSGSVTSLSPHEINQHLLDPDTVSGRVALLSVPSSIASFVPHAMTPCILEEFSPGSITARCFASRPSLAVFVEQHSPGWTASVDQHPAPVFQTNRILLGIPISQGLHRIHLQYTSPGLYLGAALSLLAWIFIVLGTLILTLRRQTPKTLTEPTDLLHP